MYKLSDFNFFFIFIPLSYPAKYYFYSFFSPKKTKTRSINEISDFVTKKQKEISDSLKFYNKNANFIASNN